MRLVLCLCRKKNGSVEWSKLCINNGTLNDESECSGPNKFFQLHSVGAYKRYSGDQSLEDLEVRPEQQPDRPILPRHDRTRRNGRLRRMTATAPPPPLRR